MTSRIRSLAAIGLFLIPVVARFFMFYQWPYAGSEIQRPAYDSFTVPEPPTPSSNPAAVAAPANTGKVIIIDAYHGNQYYPNEIEPLVTALSARGARVEFDKGITPLSTQLKYASAYAILSPSIGFSGEELRAIQQFVESGGRLLVFADPTRSLYTVDAYTGATVILPDVNYANPVLGLYGLTFVNDYLYNLQENEGNFRNVKFTEFAEAPLTAGLKMVVLYGVHSIQTNSGLALVSASAGTSSSVSDQMAAYAPLVLSANGQVLAAGDFSFLTSPFNQVADNVLQLGAVADFALAGQRTPSLANFPYLFKGPVSLVTAGEAQLEASLLDSVAMLQNALRLVSVPLELRAKAPASGEAIILGTYQAATDELASYARSFGVRVDEESESVEIQGLGTLNAANSGLLLFSQTAASKTLVVLAPSEALLPELVKLVAGGDLSACVIQENVGVCSLSGSGSEEDYSEYYSEEAPVEAEPAPAEETASPTPAG